jgi:hypothetical protein
MNIPQISLHDVKLVSTTHAKKIEGKHTFWTKEIVATDADGNGISILLYAANRSDLQMTHEG